MRRMNFTPALIAHGGAGGLAQAAERPARRRGLLAAVERGAGILREGGSALDAVIATVSALEDDGLFNAGYGSVLTTAGRPEMDAGVMVAERTASAPAGTRRRVTLRAGGVVLVSRVRNPIQLARAVMERTPHVLVGGVAAERIARQAGLRLCRPDQLVSPRARERWLATRRSIVPSANNTNQHGTVGAVAVDSRGNLAAATSTGGVTGKMPGRIGDSAIIGAGLFANAAGAASATGSGEAIMKVALCREAVLALSRKRAQEAAALRIADLHAETGAEAGIVLVDEQGHFGYAHNAQAMEVAMFDPVGGVRHVLAGRLELPRERNGIGNR
jgi:L-asparaginase / beta-aspartyl-peptidase